MHVAMFIYFLRLYFFFFVKGRHKIVNQTSVIKLGLARRVDPVVGPVQV